MPVKISVNWTGIIWRRSIADMWGIPWDILTTERCLVRETSVEDLDAFYEIYAEPSVTQYTEGLYPERAQEEAWLKDYMENMYYFYNYGVWTICDKATGQIIGRAGFSNREGYEDPELGFVIGVPWQRQGYATEVCRALLKYGKVELGFERVQMLVMPGNETSLHLAENLGFQRLDQVTWKGILLPETPSESRKNIKKYKEIIKSGLTL